MKKQINDLLLKMQTGENCIGETANQLLDLFAVSGSFILVGEQEPPHNIELLAKSPTGTIHLCHWRPAYNIFTCQAKSESSWDWSWKLI